MAKETRSPYLIIVLMSDTEQEYPLTLPLAGTAHMQPRWRRDNWALLEIAVLDVKDGAVLFRAEGRGWATLARPSAQGITQFYPVILSAAVGAALLAPTYEGIHRPTCCILKTGKDGGGVAD